jgi:hypothetical protein
MKKSVEGRLGPLVQLRDGRTLPHSCSIVLPRVFEGSCDEQPCSAGAGWCQRPLT